VRERYPAWPSEWLCGCVGFAVEKLFRNHGGGIASARWTPSWIAAAALRKGFALAVSALLFQRSSWWLSRMSRNMFDVTIYRSVSKSSSEWNLHTASARIFTIFELVA